MAKKLKTSGDIEGEIARLKTLLSETRAAEVEAKFAELNELVRRRGIIDEALEWVRAQVPTKPRRRRPAGGEP